MQHIFSFFIFLLACMSVQAENWHPGYTLSTSNGLPTDEVKQVYQDKDGFIWIATRDGLCRYDGHLLKIYKSNLYTPGLLSSNKLTVIAEDGNRSLWIGTSSGLNVLNKPMGEIRQIAPGKLNNNDIQSILTTRNNEVWIGTANGLYKYVAETDSFICYDNLTTDYRMPGNDVKTLFEDARGNIWIGTWHDGITRLDPDKGIFYPYPRINPANSAHVIFEDNQHTLWVGSWGYGLFRLENPYDPEKVVYVNYRHDKNRPGSLSDNIVYALSQDLNTNAIWIGTRSGLSILNDINNPHSFTNHLPNQSDLLYNEVNSIIRDHSGQMWLGTLGGGVSIINTANTTFKLNRLELVKNRMASNSVRSIFVDKNGVHWLGIGSYGLVSYNPHKDQYLFYEDHPDFKAEPITSTVYQVKQLKDTYWIATYGQGLYLYNPSLPTDKVRTFKVQSHSWLNDNCIFTLKILRNSEVWIGTGNGLSIYNTLTGAGESYPHLGQTPNGKRYTIYDIEEDDASGVWLATGGNGIFRIERDSSGSGQLKFHRYSSENNQLNDNNIQCIFKDSKGKIWIGSDGGGLSYYDVGRDIFVCVQQEYNIPGDIIHNITEDKQGNLWIGTNAGLVLLNKSYARQYTVADGLQDNSFNRNAVFQTPDGELFFGGHKGYNHFYPDKLKMNELISPVIITDIKIYNKSLETMEKNLRNKISVFAPGYTQKIRLPYNYNNVSIEFVSLNYSNPGRSKYAYRLNGFDKDWQYTDASRRYASYNNLKSGLYEFQLKSLNDCGIWDKPILLQVEILAPFWLSWWAYLIYCVIVGSIVYFSVKMTKHKLLIKNTIRIKDMEKQKIEEINHAKLQFFTNITHEFLTPLTILSASVDELKIISPQHDNFYEGMSNNINRLIRLLQQILEFRKAETGNLKLKVSKGDIAAFVKSSVDNFNPLMKKNKIHFSLVCDPESIPAYFDYDKMDKILFNLLSNAAKYNQPGGFVLINVNYAPDGKKKVRISVKDNGEGIQPTALKGLFKRFYEGDYRRFNTIGTGIGLSLTKDLVELHKGEISVESEVGKGTVFYVQIPIAPEFYDEAEIDDYIFISKPLSMDADPKEDEEDPQNMKEHTLLLIEDNEELLQLTVRLLGREYNIFTATNGREGIEILEKEYIDLAVSDIMMPEMDGIEFCKYVKNQFEISHVPIILLTAKSKEEDRIDAYDSGADGFISKPFNLNVLHSKIKQLLKARERAGKELKKQFVLEVGKMNYTGIDEDFLNRAVACVQEHINDANFDQQQFSHLLGTSKSTLYKKLKSLTRMNTSAFIRNIRLKTACKLIEEKRKIRISELAYAVGFNDPKYFSACFKKEFGLIPSEFLDKIIEEEEKARENTE